MSREGLLYKKWFAVSYLGASALALALSAVGSFKMLGDIEETQQAAVDDFLAAHDSDAHPVIEDLTHADLYAMAQAEVKVTFDNIGLGDFDMRITRAASETGYQVHINGDLELEAQKTLLRKAIEIVEEHRALNLDGELNIAHNLESEGVFDEAVLVPTY